jgi:hypothetical protein
MAELISSGPIPGRILEKARRLLDANSYGAGLGWKKITRINGWYSYRLNMNYRLLKCLDGPMYVCKHDVYEKKIRRLKG